MGVDEDAAKGKEIGAGDQGLMFGFACDDTPELMPLPISLAHKILHRLTEARFNSEAGWLRPDSKSQVTIEYQGRQPLRVDTVVVSTQHSPDVSNQEIREFVIEHIVKPILPAELGSGRDQVPHQSHRAIRRRRAARRLRADRAQDHRRHLRRLGAARRRGLQRQGPDQGGPQRGVHGPARRQERGCRRLGDELRTADWPTPSA